MPEGSGEFEVAGYAGDGEEAVVVWAGRCGTDCFGHLQRVRTVAKHLLRQLGDDADYPTYILTEPRFGYRMAKGEGRNRRQSRRIHLYGRSLGVDAAHPVCHNRGVVGLGGASQSP